MTAHEDMSVYDTHIERGASLVGIAGFGRLLDSKRKLATHLLLQSCFHILSTSSIPYSTSMHLPSLPKSTLSNNSPYDLPSSPSISLVAPISFESPYIAATKLPSRLGNSLCSVSTFLSSVDCAPWCDISNCSMASRCSPRSEAGTKSVSSKVPVRLGGAKGSCCWPYPCEGVRAKPPGCCCWSDWL